MHIHKILTFAEKNLLLKRLLVSHFILHINKKIHKNLVFINKYIMQYKKVLFLINLWFIHFIQKKII